MKTLPIHNKEYGLRIEEREPGHVVLFISGRIALEDMKSFLSEAKNILENKAFRKLDVNLGKVTYLDSAGTLALFQLEEDYAGRSIPVTYHDVTDEIKGILHLLNQKAHDIPPLVQRKTPNIFEQAGESTRRILDDFSRVLNFTGELFIALIHSLFKPRLVRWNDVLFYMKRAGADGLPIVGLISFLMGLIMAFMSSLQLRQFGANIYVASLVAVAW